MVWGCCQALLPWQSGIQGSCRQSKSHQACRKPGVECTPAHPCKMVMVGKQYAVSCLWQCSRAQGFPAVMLGSIPSRGFAGQYKSTHPLIEGCGLPSWLYPNYMFDSVLPCLPGSKNQTPISLWVIPFFFWSLETVALNCIFSNCKIYFCVAVH